MGAPRQIWGKCRPFPVPIPATLALALSAHVARWQVPTVLVTELGRQLGAWVLERARKTAGAKASGGDVKVVQARLRHASAKTTLDTYGHP